MRILQINKFLYPAGGTETVLFNEWRWLEAAGHTIIPFGMAHPENVTSPYSYYWPPQIDYRRPTLRQVRDIAWSRPAAERLTELIADTRPDVAHLHNIYHQLTPSILRPLAAARIPIVMTLHDYKLVCPNYRLYTEGAPCTRCVASHPWHALRHRCHHDSYAASALVALETALHRRWDAYRPVHAFIVPSHFAREIMLRGSLPAEKIHLIPHAVENNEQSTVNSKQLTDNELPPAPFFLYAGRLEPEKGVDLLLEAARRLPAVPIVIAGDGSLAGELAQAALANVTLLGKLDRLALAALREQVLAEIVPSRWYELFGMSALEAMQAGRPVIAAKIGALPELVQHEATGLLVPPNDPAALAAAMQRLWNDRLLAAQLGRAARAHVTANHRPEDHLAALLKLYDEVRVMNAAGNE